MKGTSKVFMILLAAFIWLIVFGFLLLLTGLASEFVLNREVPVIFQYLTIAGLAITWIAFIWCVIISITNKNKSSL